MNDKKYIPRRLDSSDIFPMLRILSKCHIERFNDVFEVDSGKKDNGTKIWLTFVSTICGGIGECKEDVTELISRIYGCDKSEIEKMPPAKLIELVRQILEGQDFADFFTAVLKLLLWTK